MTETENHYAEAAMLIRKPVSEVFEAFVNPDIITKYWFTKSSGRLEEGKSIDWTWEMFNLIVAVKVKTITPNEQIIIQGGEDAEAIVDWTFKKLADSQTFVTVTNRGFKGTQEELISQIRV